MVYSHCKGKLYSKAYSTWINDILNPCILRYLPYCHCEPTLEVQKPHGCRNLMGAETGVTTDGVGFHQVGAGLELFLYHYIFQLCHGKSGMKTREQKIVSLLF